MAKKKNTINVRGTEVTLISNSGGDYISLTDMARNLEGEPKDYIRNWIRNGSTVEFLGVWEKVNNPNFDIEKFIEIKTRLTRNDFLMSAKKWIEMTGAMGIEAKYGRGGGTYAHSDIAVQFATWLSPEFYVYLIKEFQRFKLIEAEGNQEALSWNLRRSITKLNHKIHTDAIKENLIPPRISRAKKGGVIYASEADVLNVAVFGMTAKEWRAFNPEQRGNIRDHATTEQLLILANLEAINAEMIRADLSQDERVARLNEAAISQMRSLLSSPSLMRLPDAEKGL